MQKPNFWKTINRKHACWPLWEKAIRLIGNVCLGLLVKRGSTQAMPEYEHVKADMEVKESHAHARRSEE